MARINPILRVAAFLALDMAFGPRNTHHSFGDQGEFTTFLEGGRWHLRGGLNMGGGTTYKTRADAFEAAADVARARGDSAEECGKLRAGVLW